MEDGEITDSDGQDEEIQNTVPDITISLNNNGRPTGLNGVRHGNNNTTYYDADARPQTETPAHKRPILQYEDDSYIEVDEWSPENDLTTDKNPINQTKNQEIITPNEKIRQIKTNKDDNHSAHATRTNNNEKSSLESRGIVVHSSDKPHNNKYHSKRSRSRDSERDGHEKSKHRKFSHSPRGRHEITSTRGRYETFSPRGRNESISSRGRNGTFSPRGGNVTFSPRGRSGTFSPRGRSGTFSPRGRSGTFSPSGRSGTFSPRGRSGTFSPRGRSGTFSPRGRSGTFSPRGRSGTFSPRGRYRTISHRGSTRGLNDIVSFKGRHDRKSLTRYNGSEHTNLDQRELSIVSSPEQHKNTDTLLNNLKHTLNEQNTRQSHCSSTKLFENGEPVESRFSSERELEDRSYSPISERSLSPIQGMLSPTCSSENTTRRNNGLVQEQGHWSTSIANECTPRANPTFCNNDFVDNQGTRFVVNDSTPYEKKEEVVAKIYDMVVNCLSQQQKGYLNLLEVLGMINGNSNFQFEFKVSDVLKELIEQYDNLFVIFVCAYETSIWPKTNVKICPIYTSNPNIKHQCNDLHMCTFYMLRTCSERNCKFGHSLLGDHNSAILQKFNLSSFNDYQIQGLMRTRESRNITTLPLICKFYNNEGGCSRQRTCKHLHVCKHFVNRDCKFTRCKRAHTFFEASTKKVLGGYYGLNMENETNDTLIKLISQTLENGNVKLKREIMKVESKLLNQQHTRTPKTETNTKASPQCDTMGVGSVNKITENPRMKWSNMTLKNGSGYIALPPIDKNDSLESNSDFDTVHAVTSHSNSSAVLPPDISEVEIEDEITDFTESGTAQKNDISKATPDFQIKNDLPDIDENKLLLEVDLEKSNDTLVEPHSIQDVKVENYDNNKSILNVLTEKKSGIAETVISDSKEDILSMRDDQTVSIHDGSDDAKLDETVSVSTSDTKEFCCIEAAIDSQMTVETSPNKSSKATQIKHFLHNRRRGLATDIKLEDESLISLSNGGITHSPNERDVVSTQTCDGKKFPLPETSTSCLPAWTPLKRTSPKPTTSDKDVPGLIQECIEKELDKSNLSTEGLIVNIDRDADELAQTTEGYIHMVHNDEAATVLQNSHTTQEAKSDNSALSENESYLQIMRKSYSDSICDVTEIGVDTANAGPHTEEYSVSDVEIGIKRIEERINGIKHENDIEKNADRGKESIKYENNTESMKDIENDINGETNMVFEKDNEDGVNGMDTQMMNPSEEKIGSGAEMDIQYHNERTDKCNDIANKYIKEGGSNGMVYDYNSEPGNEAVCDDADKDVNISHADMVNDNADGTDDGVINVEEISMEFKGNNSSQTMQFRKIYGHWHIATTSGQWKDLDSDDAITLQNAVNICKKYSSEN